MTVRAEAEKLPACDDTCEVNIVEVDLDTADYVGVVGGSGTAVSRAPLTVNKCKPAGWDGSVELLWSAGNVRVYNASSNGVEVTSGQTFANTVLPTNLWVEGSTPSSTTNDVVFKLNPVGIDCPIAADGCDRGTMTVVEVVSIDVVPKNVPSGWVPPTPVQIAAGAICSPAHQADVTIAIEPKLADVPVTVWLGGGRGHQNGKEARLVSGVDVAYGGGEPAWLTTATGGLIHATLTSSDVYFPDDETFTINAGALSTPVQFSWDEYSEPGEWTFEPGYLPVPGVLTNHLILRHHRGPGNCTTNNYSPWVPLGGHEIRMFVEELEYWDDEGDIQTLTNTPEDPADLSAWATFPESPTVTDADGQVTINLTLHTNNIASVLMAAYDWSIYRQPSELPPTFLSCLNVAGQKALAGGGTEDRTTHVKKDTTSYDPFASYIVLWPNAVPVVSPTVKDEDNEFGGQLVVFLGFPTRLQAFQTYTVLEICQDNVWRTATDNEGKLDHRGILAQDNYYYLSPEHNEFNH